VRIGVIAPNRNPLCEPFAGGTEAHTVDLARGLRARGHTVSVFGPVGSPSDLVDRDDVLPVLSLSETALRDVSSAPAWFLAQHHAYLALMLRLQGEARDRFDVIHDNAIHYLTLSMASSTGVPTVATLHTPPTPWAESGFAASAGPRPVLRAVSQSSARLWAESLGPVPVIANGVDTAAFVPGPGGGGAVWIGRLVPEKGADHAIAAARHAGVALTLAGPVGEPEWFSAHVRPQLGGQISYAGHLSRPELVHLLGASSVLVATPRWDEPFGLAVAEALACGTPVASYARGAATEILDDSCGATAIADDVLGLGAAVTAAAQLDRAAARRRAVDCWSVERMVDEYSALYRSLSHARPRQTRRPIHQAERVHATDGRARH
jgi:glycosyltransferase involved in cell wall biosynthesis